MRRTRSNISSPIGLIGELVWVFFEGIQVVSVEFFLLVEVITTAPSSPIAAIVIVDFICPTCFASDIHIAHSRFIRVSHVGPTILTNTTFLFFKEEEVVFQGVVAVAFYTFVVMGMVFGHAAWRIIHAISETHVGIGTATLAASVAF